MYYLHTLSLHFPQVDFFRAFNVFQYITFRAIAAAITSFLLSLMFGNWVIRRLVSLKVGQPIRTKAEINKLLISYGVPLLDETGAPITSNNLSQKP